MPAMPLSPISSSASGQSTFPVHSKKQQQQQCLTLIASCSASSLASTSRLALGLGLPTKKVFDVSPW